jgi:hypothetical protein
VFIPTDSFFPGRPSPFSLIVFVCLVVGHGRKQARGVHCKLHFTRRLDHDLVRHPSLSTGKHRVPFQPFVPSSGQTGSGRCLLSATREPIRSVKPDRRLDSDRRRGFVRSRPFERSRCRLRWTSRNRSRRSRESRPRIQGETAIRSFRSSTGLEIRPTFCYLDDSYRHPREYDHPAGFPCVVTLWYHGFSPRLRMGWLVLGLVSAARHRGPGVGRLHGLARRVVGMGEQSKGLGSVLRLGRQTVVILVTRVHRLLCNR